MYMHMAIMGKSTAEWATNELWLRAPNTSINLLVGITLLVLDLKKEQPLFTYSTHNNWGYGDYQEFM